MENNITSGKTALFSEKITILKQATEAHVSRMAHMCFSNIEFVNRIFKYYLEFQGYDGLSANMVFLNLAAGLSVNKFYSCVLNELNASLQGTESSIALGGSKHWWHFFRTGRIGVQAVNLWERRTPFSIYNEYKMDRMYRHITEKIFFILAGRKDESAEWNAEISTSENMLIMRGGDIEKQLAIGYERFLLRGMEKADAVFGIRSVAWEYATNRLVKNEGRVQKSIAEKITGWNAIVQNKISLYENSYQKDLEEKVIRWDRNIQNKLILWNEYFEDGRPAGEKRAFYKQRVGVRKQQGTVEARYIKQSYADRNYRYENYDTDILEKRIRQEEWGYTLLPERTLQSGVEKIYSRVRNEPNASLLALGGCARVAEHPVDVRLATTEAERRPDTPAPLGRSLPRNRKVPLEKLSHAPLLCCEVFDFFPERMSLYVIENMHFKWDRLYQHITEKVFVGFKKMPCFKREKLYSLSERIFQDKREGIQFTPTGIFQRKDKKISFPSTERMPEPAEWNAEISISENILIMRGRDIEKQLAIGYKRFLLRGTEKTNAVFGIRNVAREYAISGLAKNESRVQKSIAERITGWDVIVQNKISLYESSKQKNLEEKITRWDRNIQNKLILWNGYFEDGRHAEERGGFYKQGAGVIRQWNIVKVRYIAQAYTNRNYRYENYVTDALEKKGRQEEREYILLPERASHSREEKTYSRVRNEPNASLLALGDCARVAEHPVDVRLATTEAERRPDTPAPLGRSLPRNRKVLLEKLSHAPLLCCGVFDFFPERMSLYAIENMHYKRDRMYQQTEEKINLIFDRMLRYTTENMRFKWDRLYQHITEKVFVGFKKMPCFKREKLYSLSERIFQEKREGIQFTPTGMLQRMDKKISFPSTERMLETAEWNAEKSISENILIVWGGDIEKQFNSGYERILLQERKKADAVFGIRNAVWEYAINRLVKNESRVQKSNAEKITGWNTIVQNKISLYKNSKQKDLWEKIIRWDRNIQNKLVLWNRYFEDGRHAEGRGGIYKQRAGVIRQRNIVKVRYIAQAYTDRNYRYENYDTDALEKKGRQEEREYILLLERALHNREEKTYSAPEKMSPYAIENMHYKWDRLYRHTEEKMYLIFERISKHTAEKMPEPVEWDAEISTSEYTLIMRGGNIEKQLAIGYERFFLRGTEKANAVFGIRNVAWEYAINRLVKNESRIQKSVAEKITGWNVIVQNKISLYENSKQKNLEEKITRWDRNIQNKLILWNRYFKDGKHAEERGGIYKQRAGVIGQQDIVKAQYINQLYIDRNYRYENYDIDTLTKKSRQEERKYIFLPERTLHNSEGKFFLQEREKTDAAFNIRNAAWEYAINGLVTNESRLKKSIAEKITRWNKIVQNKLAFWVENVEKTGYSFYKAAVSAKSEDVLKTLKLIDEKYMMQFPANESAKYADSELIQKKYFWHDREESSKKIIHLTRDSSGSGAAVREQKPIQNEINELKHDLTEEIHKNVMERETMKLLEEKIVKQQEQIEELKNMYYKVEKSFWAIQDSQEQERAYSRIFGNEIKLERMRHGIAPI